ncbi:MAG: YncE family protein [Bacteroidota bacterium]
MKAASITVTLASIIFTSLIGCVKDPTTAAPEIPLPSAKGVYIINEGNFGRANASLSYYDLESFRVYNDVFTAVNGKSLGDVAAGMGILGNEGFIIVNNSQKIEIIDLQTNLESGTIATGPGSSPRQMAFVRDSLALVTDLYGNQVLKVRLRSRSVIGAIPVGDNPEGIAIANGKAYIANSGFGAGKTVSVISLATMAVVATIPVTDNPNGVQVTPAGFVYVVCAGSYGDFANPDDDTPAKVMVIDPSMDAVVDSILLGGHAMNIAIGLDGIGYVASTSEVLRIDTRIHRVTGQFKSGSYYSVGVESASGDVYLSDPKSFVQPGTVYVYAANGQLRNQFDTGLIPGSFAFKR